MGLDQAIGRFIATPAAESRQTEVEAAMAAVERAARGASAGFPRWEWAEHALRVVVEATRHDAPAPLEGRLTGGSDEEAGLQAALRALSADATVRSSGQSGF